MKRSSSLPHIPFTAPPLKRQRQAPAFQQSKSPTSILQLPDDVLTRIYHKLLKAVTINVTAALQVSQALPLASACRRLRHIFFSSVHTIDCTISHASYALPEHYHNKQCTTCPSMIPFPLVHLLIRRAGFHLRVLRLPTLDIESTALVISSVCESCPQLTELVFTDGGAVNHSLSREISLLSALTRLSVCEPSIALLEHLCRSSASLTDLTFLSVSTTRAPHVTTLLNANAKNVRKLKLTFFEEKRFLSDPFSFPRLNLHRVYPNMHLDISKHIEKLLQFLTDKRACKLPLLSCLVITTVGADLNQEGCDLINCPPPIKGLDAICGTVRLVRNATQTPVTNHPLREIVLRTDHLLINSSLRALKGLLSPHVAMKLHVNDLTIGIPPQCESSNHLTHSIHAVRLESLLHDNVNISKHSNLAFLKIVDISSAHFCLQYARNTEAYRPKLISLLDSAGDSLTTIRLTTFAKKAPSSTIGKPYIMDVLSHAQGATVLEISDQFLITMFYRDNLTDLSPYMRNFQTIRFGSLKWATYHNAGNFTRAITEFFQVLPDFFRFLASSCPLLRNLVMLSVYHEERAARFRECQSLRNAVKALEGLESCLPDVDTCTVRAQLRLWLCKGRRAS